MKLRSYVLVLGLCVLVPPLAAQKKPLDHSVYDGWKSIRGTTFSKDGKWILYIVAPQEGDTNVEIRSTTGGKTYDLPRGSQVQFSNDSRFVIATIVPALADTKKATRDKVLPADMPKNSLLILNLGTGEQTKIDKVTSFLLPAEDSGWMTYRPEAPRPAGAANSSAGQTRPAAPGGGRRGGGVGARGGGGAGAATASQTGSPLVIRNLNTGKEQKIENVGDLAVTKDGKILAYTIVSKDGKEDGVYRLDLTTNTTKEVFKGKAKYPHIVLNDQTKALAFLTDKSDEPAPKPADAEEDDTQDVAPKAPAKKSTLSLYVFDPKSGKTTLIANEKTKSLPNGWVISDNSPLSFSESGKRILFGTAPKPAEEKKDDTPDSEKVSVDVWNWQDKKIMPQQLLQAAADQRRTYEAVAFLDSGKVVQLETKEIPTVTIGDRNDGPYAIATTDDSYRLAASWDEDYSDVYILDLATGKPRKLIEKSGNGVGFSPDGKYISGFDSKTNQYFVVDPVTLKRTDFKIPTTLYDEEVDTPSTPPAYGEAGWTKDDKALIVYDAYDLWSIDPTGKTAPTCLTHKGGRLTLTRYRYIRTDPEARFIDPAKPILLSTQDTDRKTSGFCTFDIDHPDNRPVKLISANKGFSPPIIAKTGDVMAYTQQDFVEFPDVWLAKPDFSGAHKISNANPQQAQYNWGNAELVNWVSGDGQKLKGILIKPENFTYGKKYPMITYFYERMSDTINSYHAPAPSASTINWSEFASNGYVVFIPDIPYKTGYPGESAVSAIVSGVLSIVNRGYVDPDRLGIQGHSWGGYQVAYLVTHTNLFKCAEAGAAVGDMFSAYGGIRYGTGILREGQYEHGQSRIAGTPWDKTLRYVENSPIFWLDKVQTPLLMLQNDKDGAVPFTQGIELFSGLRRLGKPAWLVVYNGEDHNLVERKNRKDWSVRLQQFFDHYLKDAPMPIWMSKGVPATMKGKTFGLELDTDKP